MLAFTAFVFLALGVVRRTPHPLLTAVYQFRHLILILSVPLALAAVQAGEPVAAWVFACAAGCWARDFGGRLRSVKRAPGHGRQGDLSLVTLNAGDHRSDPAKIADYIREKDGDVVCLQEVHEGHQRQFDQDLSDQYPYRSYQDSGIGGLAILSKHPMADEERLELGGPLAHLMVTVEAPSRSLRLINAHPFVSIAFRGEKSTVMQDFEGLAALSLDGKPTVIMGDFNTTDQSSAYRKLEEAGLIDSFKVASGTFGPTFPVPMRYLYVPCPPVVRIDFAWHTRDFLAVSSNVGRDASSDHLPLETTLAWRLSATSDTVDRGVDQSRSLAG